MKRGGPLRRRAHLRRKRPIRYARKAEAVAERQAWRELVLKRAGYACERCPDGWPLEVHHLLPRGRGGKDWPFNGAALCSECHRCVHERREGWEGFLARTEAEARAIRDRLDNHKG